MEMDKKQGIIVNEEQYINDFISNKQERDKKAFPYELINEESENIKKR